MISIFTAFIILLLVNCNINTEEKTIKVFDEVNTYTINNNQLTIYEENGEHIVFDCAELDINKFLGESKLYQITIFSSIFITIIIFLFIMIKAMSYLEKLFININREDTPFSHINMIYIKKVAIYMTLGIIVPTVLSFLINIISNGAMDYSISTTDIVTVLVLFSLYYIFKYGYEIQLDSKGKIYGSEDNKNIE